MSPQDKKDSTANLTTNGGSLELGNDWGGVKSQFGGLGIQFRNNTKTSPIWGSGVCWGGLDTQFKGYK